jgi:hypothetical protein
VGDGALKEAVMDSGPLIHLAEISCLQLLSIFNILHIPHAVWLETVEQERLSEKDLFGVTNIQRYALSHSEINS